MYAYCSIIQKYILPSSGILLNDDSFYKKNTDEVIYQTYQVVFHKNEVTRSNDMVTETNKLNLYYLLIRMITMYKNEKDTIRDFVTEKYSYLKSIFENIFFNNTNKELFLNDFSKIQRVYFALSKFVKMYKYKKSSVKINTDLYMNELDETMKNVFVLYENGAKYYFSVSDLVNIMNSSLSHTYNFFSEPLKPKNPYNNLPLSKSTLYNIYFFMRRSSFIMPQLFEQYFICNFDIKLFKTENECLIRDFSIKRYIYSSNYDTLYDNVLIMIEDLKKQYRKYKHFMNIDEQFPQRKLVDIMRPYLHLYYLSKYYVSGTEKKNESMSKLMTKFDLFVRFNPQFGRKIIKIQRIPKKKVTVEYNDKHMNFYKEYPRSAFPKLPTIININNINNSYDSPISTEFVTSLFQRFVNTRRLTANNGPYRQIESILTSSSSEGDFENDEEYQEDEEGEQEDEYEVNEEEQDT
jgi:hypothetical protein